MLACIACKKDGGDDTARDDTPRVKSLTSQIKDMVLKISGSSRQCKGGAASAGVYRQKGSYNRHRSQSDGEEDSHYGYLGSSNSTPAWDFTNIGRPSDSVKSHWVNRSAIGDQNGEAAKEWNAIVEPGVQITFMSLPGGSGNDLKRIRFSREMFNKWQAQRWWGENFDRIMELYNVQKFSRQALPTPPRSEEDGESSSALFSRVGSTRGSPAANTPPLFGRINTNKSTCRPQSSASSSTRAVGGGCFPSVPDPSEHILPHHFFHHNANAAASIDAASRTTTSSRDEAASISISNASDLEVTEWVEQDEAGVYITIRECPDGNRELRRVRFSRERFGEVHAKLWWEDNRERIQSQYL